jgi:hypothetical protein
MVLSWGMGALPHFVFWSPRPNNSPLQTSTQLLLGKRAASHLANSCWQWGRRGRRDAGALVSGVDPCDLQGIELDRGVMHQQRWVFLPKIWNCIFCTCWDINLERAFSIQGPNRSARRSIKRGPARGNNQGAQQHVLSQKDHELDNFYLLFVMCSLNCWAMSLTTPDLLV